MSDPAPTPLEYQTPQPKDVWPRPRLGKLALTFAIVQIPWLFLDFFVFASCRMGNPINLGIDTLFDAFFWLPSLSALFIGIWVIARGNKAPTQRVLALIAVLLAAAFLSWA